MKNEDSSICWGLVSLLFVRRKSKFYGFTRAFSFWKVATCHKCWQQWNLENKIWTQPTLSKTQINNDVNTRFHYVANNNKTKMQVGHLLPMVNKIKMYLSSGMGKVIYLVHDGNASYYMFCRTSYPVIYKWGIHFTF